MKRSLLFAFFLFLVSAVMASPVLQMNRAFMALADLIPFLTQRERFMEKKNEKLIQEKIVELQSAFKSARHDSVLKEDLFAPSYAVIMDSLDSSLGAFNQGKKDYAHWRLKEITSHCLDCHTRLPPSYTSSFQNGELAIDERKFADPYNLGIAQLIVRRYVDAKNSFVRSVQDRMIKKDYQDIILPFKQILVIETKVLKNPDAPKIIFNEYVNRKELPEETRKTLKVWITELEHWKNMKTSQNGFKNDKEVDSFIQKELVPLQKTTTLFDANDVSLLFSSGLLANYLFENPSSPKAPDISYWLGWTEKQLKREDFFGSGDLFLKQCVKRYPKNPIAKKCLEQYRESVEFEFTGSSGTHIPPEVEKELNELTQLLKKK